MKHIIILLTLLFTVSAQAQVAGWFTNTDAVGNSEPATFYEQIMIGSNGETIRVKTGSADPTSVATYGEIGDLYISSTGLTYQKVTTTGNDTNWNLMLSGTFNEGYVLFGASDGGITQDADITYSSASNTLNVPYVKVTSGSNTIAALQFSDDTGSQTDTGFYTTGSQLRVTNNTAVTMDWSAGRIEFYEPLRGPNSGTHATAAEPAFSFAGSASDTGMYREQPDDGIGFSINATTILKLDEDYVSMSAGLSLPIFTDVERDALTGTPDKMLIWTDYVSASGSNFLEYYDSTFSTWQSMAALRMSNTDALFPKTYNFVSLPYLQMTETGDFSSGEYEVRIETGNDNFLENPSFESSTFDDGWITSGSATTVEGFPEVWEGTGSAYVSATGTDVLFYQDKVKTQHEGVTMGATCMVKTDSSKVQLCVGTTSEDRDCVYHDGSNQWRKLQALMMPDSTGEMRITLKGDGVVTPSFYVDSCEWSNDPLKVKGAIRTQTISAYAASNSIVTQNNPPEWTLDLSQLTISGNECFEVSNVGLRTEFRAKKECDVKISAGLVNESTGNIGRIYKNGVPVAGGSHNYTIRTTSATNWNGQVVGGDIISIGSTTFAGSGTDIFSLSILAQSISREILTASDIVSSETMNFQFKGSLTGPIDCNTDPVGTYTTYSKAASSNTFTQCASQPNASWIPNNLDGVPLRATPWNNNSGCVDVLNPPSRFDICIGKDLRGVKYFGYAGTAKSGEAIDTGTYNYDGGTGVGTTKIYNESDGKLILNTGFSQSSGETQRFFQAETVANLTRAYFHFHASKNPVVNAMETIPRIDYSWENEFSASIENDTTVVSINSQTPNGPIATVTYGGTAGRVNVAFKAGFFSQIPSVVATPNRDSAGAADRSIAVSAVTTSGFTVQVQVGSTGAGTNDDFDLHISRQGSDYKERGSAAAIIAQPTCFIKDVKPNGTNGGTSVTLSFVTRDLNTLEGQCKGISLSSNVVTITEAGSWVIEAKSPARGTDLTSLNWIKNPTGAGAGEEILTGMSARCENNTFHNDCVVHLDSSFITTGSSTTFELQMFTSTNNQNAGISLGSGPISDGLPETYSVVKLIRIK